jgi:ABC-type proline/glycine betaine transport system ATPase subunit
VFVGQVDPHIRDDMQALLLRLQRELNKTVVFITHDLDEAMRIADRMMVLKDGAIEQEGDTQEIARAPKAGYARFVAEINRAQPADAQHRARARRRASGSRPWPSGSSDCRAPLRASADDTLLEEAIRSAITRKPRGHDFDYSRQTVAGQVSRHMSHTGG